MEDRAHYRDTEDTEPTRKREDERTRKNRTQGR